MSGRIAVDFGTSNTVVAVWDAAQRVGVPRLLGDFGRMLPAGDAEVPVVPSVIYYGDNRTSWIGAQVGARGLTGSERTFRWMKRYIAHRSPVRKRIAGREIAHADAGRDFLGALLASTREELGAAEEEIALTVPVESFEHYEEWLGRVAAGAGVRRFRMIDEATAAALGYGAHAQPGDVYAVFDFGGGTLDVAVVRLEEESGGGAAGGGRRCRVLGKAGAALGGQTVDQWLFAETLARAGRRDTDDDVRAASNRLLLACEAAKTRLSSAERAEVRVDAGPAAGSAGDAAAALATEFTRGDLEGLFDRHGGFTEIDRAVRRALNAARERGYDEESVKSVFLVGGSSLIPCVQQTLRRIFGAERVRLERPLDAVARGAAAFVAGVEVFDHIQHDYAIRWANPQRAAYEFRTLVTRGTPYPTREPVARMTVKATVEGQTRLGLAIFELAERGRGGGGRGGPGTAAVELIFDPSGAARLVEVSPAEEEERAHFWMNERNPTFLAADPPARRGEARFEVEFSVDANKQLLVTARELPQGRLVLRDQPVVKLT
ncbi:MAG: Hsp70 family protein [Planctomycetes bacterium]|nr:Hsp70 family protein [Planctomycetota bacterium]